MRDQIHKLSPAAARFVLAFMTRKDGEEFDVVLQRSGISKLATWRKTKQELVSLGILLETNGALYLNNGVNLNGN